jgi:competence protein ComEC
MASSPRGRDVVGSVGLAGAVMAGALAARPVPIALALLGVAAALSSRRMLLLCGAVAVLASSLGARSAAGLVPVRADEVDATVTLLTDPAPAIGGTQRGTVRLGHHRLDAWARKDASTALAPRLAGERVHVTGVVRPLSDRVKPFLAPKHIVGRLSVTTVDRPAAGDLASRLANAVRRDLTRGASSLPGQQRALFLGFVLGDNRGQSAETKQAFQDSGLTHLLVVSGENVAFVLVVAGPLIRVLGLRGRLVAGFAVLFLFGVLTRWEPSVLRAEAMAALAMTATTFGRRAPPLRLLSLAVCGLVLVDPLLVHSVGFLLSVGACTGIALLAKPIARRVPGPRPLAEALAITAAAQVGVAPILMNVFGGVPVASLPANLLAIPAAGPIMVWGMTAGLLAGLVPPPVAFLLHLPTRVLLWWVAGVAHRCAALPLGHVGG